MSVKHSWESGQVTVGCWGLSWSLNPAAYQLCDSGPVTAMLDLSFLSCISFLRKYTTLQLHVKPSTQARCWFFQTVDNLTNFHVWNQYKLLLILFSLARVLGLHPVFMDCFLQAISERSAEKKWSTNSWFWVLCLPNRGLYLSCNLASGEVFSTCDFLCG